MRLRTGSLPNALFKRVAHDHGIVTRSRTEARGGKPCARVPDLEKLRRGIEDAFAELVGGA